MSYKFDIGVYIVPKHVFEDVDWSSFVYFDLKKGWPLTTGLWKVVSTSPEQKLIDRRDSWWAVDQGLVPKLRDVERIVYIPNPGEQQMAQAYIANEADAGLDLRPATIEKWSRTVPR